VKGIILAGGKGTRLFPLTKATNKHLLPLGKEPMLYHPIRHMCAAEIEDILVVTSTQHMGDVVNCLGSGAEFGCSLTYKVQEEAAGIADALRLGESFAGKEKVCVILGDNVFENSIAPYAQNFERQKKGARVVVKEVGEPERYGIAAMDERQIIDIEEKPKNPKSKFAVVGLYFYDNQVWDIIRNTQRSRRGEFEITSVNNAYIERSQLRFDVCEGRWSDAGTFDSWMEASKLMFENNNEIRQWKRSQAAAR
jgi:glucose-1-phosphate thymidylyltransferase